MKRHLNLIPASTQRQQLMRRVSRVGSTSIVLSGAVIAVLLGGEWAQGWLATQQLRGLEVRYEPLRQIIDQQSELAKQIEQLRARELLTLRLSREARELTLLGAVAQAANRTDERVFIKQFRYSRPAIESEQASAGGELHLSGAGVDGAAIAEFATLLRQTGVFHSVSIESTGAMPTGEPGLQCYQLTCRL